MAHKLAVDPHELVITTADIDAAQSTSHLLLVIARSQPENIGIGALVMATSLAARELNIPMDSIAAIVTRTLAEVYSIDGHSRFTCTVN